MSTGGCPQIVETKVRLLRDFYNIKVIEWECIAWTYVVQKNRVVDMLGDNYITLWDNKEYHLFNIIDDFKPDYVMVEEFSETFMEEKILKRFYNKDRKYKIFETTHSSHTQPSWKRYHPDKFIFVAPYSLSVFKDMGVPMDLIEYPIDFKIADQPYHQNILNLDPDYKHVINLGLFTQGKNQGYAFEIARLLEDYKIKFHFIGNQASNFINYWKPIMDTKPKNCEVWGERSDINSFIQASDIHLFTSILELNPLSIKESLEYQKPTLVFNLPTYFNKYDDTKNLHYLTGEKVKDAHLLLSLLGF